MKLYKIFANSIFRFPIERESYFPIHLENIFNTYKALLNEIDDEHVELVEECFKSVEKTCDEILQITNLLFEGKSILAYEKVNILLSRLQDYLIHPKSKNVVSPNSHFFKGRVGNGQPFTRKDMFHIPFEDRYKVASNRFSVTGLPCLYLSDSIYTCWEELRRPQFSQLFVSRFIEFKVNLKFLDLVPKFDWLEDVLSDDLRESAHIGDLVPLAKSLLPQALNLYPLLTACYTKVRDVNSTFKPEYIFPQLLMQWVLNKEELDGIKYSSTRCTPNRNLFNIHEPLNYALPVRSISESGYCHSLCSKLIFTEPISWELLNIVNPTFEIERQNGRSKHFDEHNRMTYNLLGDEIRHYATSAFGLLESELYKGPFLPLNMEKNINLRS